MKKFWVILLFAIFLMGCAAATPEPTIAPTTKPAASATSSVPRSPAAPAAPAISFQDTQSQKQSDGNIRTTARVTAAENLGLGQIDLAFPETMNIGETRTVRLKLAPATQLAALTPVVAAPAKTPDLPSFVYKFGGNVDLYPLMIAELRALKFDVKPTGAQRRTVDPKKEVIWDWLVSPTTPGKHDLSLELSIPAIVSGVESEISTDVLKNLVFTIAVTQVQPSLLSRIMDSIADNAGPLLVALIGLIGTIIGIIVKTRSEKPKSKSSKL
jgi:hypothetical protein